MRKGVLDIERYLDTQTLETTSKLSMFEAKFIIEKHITQDNNALTTQQNMDLLLNSIVYAQTGVKEPQIVPPHFLSDSL
jgi:hypothetical protein